MALSTSPPRPCPPFGLSLPSSGTSPSPRHLPLFCTCPASQLWVAGAVSCPPRRPLFFTFSRSLLSLSTLASVPPGLSVPSSRPAFCPSLPPARSSLALRAAYVLCCPIFRRFFRRVAAARGSPAAFVAPLPSRWLAARLASRQRLVALVLPSSRSCPPGRAPPAVGGPSGCRFLGPSSTLAPCYALGPRRNRLPLFPACPGAFAVSLSPTPTAARPRVALPRPLSPCPLCRSSTCFCSLLTMSAPCAPVYSLAPAPAPAFPPLLFLSSLLLPIRFCRATPLHPSSFFWHSKACQPSRLRSRSPPPLPAPLSPPSPRRPSSAVPLCPPSRVPSRSLPSPHFFPCPGRSRLLPFLLARPSNSCYISRLLPSRSGPDLCPPLFLLGWAISSSVPPLFCFRPFLH